MPGFARLPAAQAVQAMQQVNITAVTPPFMLVLFGSAALATAATIVAFASHSSGAVWVLVGSVVYVVVVLGLTMVVHVPLNDSLAAVAPNAPDIAAQWSGFLGAWVPWNHVRALGGVVSATALVVGALRS